MSKKERLSTEAYKGVRDFYPEEQALLNYLTSVMRSVVERVGYVEYHASVLESAELYRAKGAENEELTNEQTYTFLDRGGREVTLRPEMTPTVARMVAAKRRELGFPLRLYSIPNVFRYERPQKGRLREHWQLNVDLFGSRSLYADAEIIGVAYGIMRAFGAKESDFEIRLGSRNALEKLDMELINREVSSENRKKIRVLLDKKGKMSEGERQKELEQLANGPFEITETADIVEIRRILSDLGVTNATFDPNIVRGFDYYTGMIFEVFDTHPSNNRSLFGGGRYDNLTALFDDEPTPGVGFGMGDVTLRDFLAVRGLTPPYRPPTHVYVAVATPELVGGAWALAAELRQQGVNAALDFGERKLGDQLKTASKHKIPYLIVVGQNEIASSNFAVRNLETGEEKTLAREQLAAFFLNL
ncbi:MAG: histidine--tRNA ligase [bacterium]|nr:histidine--tRNA ligase [bacterium]